MGENEPPIRRWFPPISPRAALAAPASRKPPRFRNAPPGRRPMRRSGGSLPSGPSRTWTTMENNVFISLTSPRRGRRRTGSVACRRCRAGAVRQWTRVVVAHGLFPVPFQFRALMRALRRTGFAPVFFRYASWRQSADVSARRLVDYLDRIRCSGGSFPADSPRPGGEAEPVHFVGYSLGALVIRAAIAARPGFPVGRFVMIAPPNGGAGLLSQPLPRWAAQLGGPALADLREGSDFLRSLPPPPDNAGIIAGDRPFSPLYPSWWHRRHLDRSDPHDGAVEVANTRLAGVPHVTVAESHTSICWSREVIALVRTFFETGRFPAVAASPPEPLPQPPG